MKVSELEAEANTSEAEPWCLALAQRVGNAVLRELARVPWGGPDTAQLRDMERTARDILRVAGAVMTPPNRRGLKRCRCRLRSRSRCGVSGK